MLNKEKFIKKHFMFGKYLKYERIVQTIKLLRQSQKYKINSNNEKKSSKYSSLFC